MVWKAINLIEQYVPFVTSARGLFSPAPCHTPSERLHWRCFHGVDWQAWVLVANVRILLCSNSLLLVFQMEWNEDEWVTGRDDAHLDRWFRLMPSAPERGRTWKTLFASLFLLRSFPGEFGIASNLLSVSCHRRLQFAKGSFSLTFFLFWNARFPFCLTANKKEKTFFVQHAQFCALNSDYATVLFQVFSCCD